jgi:hypothetical protein
MTTILLWFGMNVSLSGMRWWHGCLVSADIWIPTTTVHWNRLPSLRKCFVRCGHEKGLVDDAFNPGMHLKIDHDCGAQSWIFPDFETAWPRAYQVVVTSSKVYVLIFGQLFNVICIIRKTLSQPPLCFVPSGKRLILNKLRITMFKMVYKIALQQSGVNTIFLLSLILFPQTIN